jgi:LAO/AO transport system kinase
MFSGIKRGIVEMSDLILVNKSDGDLLASARRTASDYTSALKFMRPRLKIWKPRVCLVSSKLGTGIDDAWEKINIFKGALMEHGEFHKQRSIQRKKWMWNYINNRLLDAFNQHYGVRTKRQKLEELVLDQNLSPGEASDVLISEFLKSYNLSDKDVKK